MSLQLNKKLEFKVIQTAGHKINELQVVNRVIMKYLHSLIFYNKMDDNSVSIEVHESFGVSK